MPETENKEQGKKEQGKKEKGKKEKKEKEKKEKAKKGQKDNSKGYFSAHQCNLPPNKLNQYHIECGRLRKLWVNLTCVRMDDVRARNMFRSYAALCAERYRQIKYFPCSIHPFSALRFWMETYIIIAMLTSNLLIAVHICETVPIKTHQQYILLIDIIYIMNILMSFVTGFIEGNTQKHVVLDLKRIIFKYVKTWLIIDVLCILSIVGLLIKTQEMVRQSYLMVAMRILRMPGWLQYLDNVTTVIGAGILTKTLCHLFVLLFSFLTWNIYFQFIVEYLKEGSTQPTSPSNCSWLYIAKLWNGTHSTRFLYSLDRAVGMLRRNSNMNLTDKDTCNEVFYIIAWSIANLLIYHCTLKYIVSRFGSESAKAKYFIMTKQVENFMIQRKLPPRIKNKILKFYAIRFQSNFFVESKMLECATGQLREDIIMHTGRQLVRDINFLRQMPRALHLQIGSKLKIVVYIAGDIIFKINTIGDCLYFIDKGTVAIYSESGNEICHLEDGDFFGEIALVMKHRFRTSSVVAVTNCELFRLDKKDFDSTIACYPTVYENIKRVAVSRFENTYILDEHHKAEMKMGGDHNKKADIDMQRKDS